MKKFALSLLAGASLFALASAPALAGSWDSHNNGGNNNPPAVVAPQIDVLVAVNKNSGVSVNGTINPASGGLNNNGDGSSISISGIGAAAIKSDTVNAAGSSFTPCSCATTGNVVAVAANIGSPVNVTGVMGGAANNNGTGSNVGISGAGAIAQVANTTNFSGHH